MRGKKPCRDPSNKVWQSTWGKWWLTHWASLLRWISKMRSGIVHHKSDRKSCVLPTADRNTKNILRVAICKLQSSYTNTQWYCRMHMHGERGPPGANSTTGPLTFSSLYQIQRKSASNRNNITITYRYACIVRDWEDTTSIISNFHLNELKTIRWYLQKAFSDYVYIRKIRLWSNSLSVHNTKL